MAKNNYMVAESTNLTGARIFSLQATKDIQNGAVVGKGDLLTGETQIYNALDAYDNGMYLVLNPAWSYKNSITEQNEENYVNKASVPFRAYKLEKDMKYKVYNIEDTFEVGDVVKYDAATGKYAKDTEGTGALKVVAVEEQGFPFCIGSYGVQLAGDTDNEYGHVIGAKTVKYTIEVIK